MRVDRVEPSRHKKGRVLVFLEDGACLKITEQELLDFGLRSGDELDADTLSRLRAAAGVSNVKASAADLIGKRAEAIDVFLQAKCRGALDQREKKRLSDALLRRGFAWADIRAGLARLEEIHPPFSF